MPASRVRRRSWARIDSAATLGVELAAEVVPRVLEELGEPVTIVSEPLVGSVGPLGVLSLAFLSNAELSEPDLRFLSTLAGLTAQALERAQVFEHEREALRAAEAGRERLSLLSEVTRLLSSSLEPTTVIRRTMSLVEGRLADSCVVQVPDESGLVRLDVREPKPSDPRPSARAEPDTVSFDSPAPAAVAYRTGRTQLAPLEGADETDPQAVSTVLAVPLTANGEVIGVMTFIDGPGRLFEADDVSLATEVASSHRCRPLERHPLPARARGGGGACSAPCSQTRCPRWTGCGSTPSTGPVSPGATPAATGTTSSSSGNDSIFFSVGDVMGKGAPAAALMGQVRSAIRAYAVSGQSPTEVLSSLDRFFNTLVEDRVVTAVVGTITPSSGRVVLSNAGHPPPLVVRADGTATFCPLQHSLLIAAGLDGAPRPRDELVLDRGDSLIMYSDGLIERRGELITNGMDRLGDGRNRDCEIRMARQCRRDVRVDAERRGTHR